MIDVNYITLENGREYIIIGALENKENKYLYLVNENDKLDICLRKVILENDKEVLTKLENEEEFEEVMDLFYKEFNRKEENNEE